eukprot:m.193777 g.193777  ORF g.193777 m.193777 type:complete len:211 (-) comp15668_c0_seq14:3260-3892(-)
MFPHLQLRFYIGGGNGISVLSAPFLARGWTKIEQGKEGRADTNFKIKWCERASDFDFDAFKEKKQLIGRNPKIACIGNKLRLKKTLTEFHALPASEVRGMRMKMHNYVPATYELENMKERLSFFDQVRENPQAAWIIKPTGLNCGQGIFVVEDGPAYVQRLKEEEATRNPHKRKLVRIAQKYITNPLLLQGIFKEPISVQAVLFIFRTQV